MLGAADSCCTAKHPVLPVFGCDRRPLPLNADISAVLPVATNVKFVQQLISFSVPCGILVLFFLIIHIMIYVLAGDSPGGADAEGVRETSLHYSRMYRRAGDAPFTC